ncbi:hypothetical protein F2Q68_00031378 [Brassica cretica]|uniref:Uncharacterized protein n=1 Tax=Brassica cretica TaxID=69181 RepID=A0A8S9GJM3_BRACR|nr:hypothetical protein F2Q68_00031378 [Brassica cretica]
MKVETLKPLKRKKHCNCKHSRCLKLEPANARIAKNFDGSQERQALFHGENANNITYLQQGANAVITEAVGTSAFAPFSSTQVEFYSNSNNLYKKKLLFLILMINFSKISFVPSMYSSSSALMLVHQDFVIS